MNETSRQILRALPHSTDADLKILIGRLTLHMYGAEVIEQMLVDYVILERKRREAIAI